MRKSFGTVNLCTEEHSLSYRSSRGPIPPEITIPKYRARLSIFEARELVVDLLTALQEAAVNWPPQEKEPTTKGD
jgi:hypothetical protein